ncbi:hypothetical protein Tco_0709835 [Tanacetum coccineum]
MNSNTLYPERLNTRTSDMLNTAYPSPLDTAYPVLCPIQRIHLNRLIWLRMTKVIKGEFEKIKDVKVKDVSLTCDTPLEIFNMEVSRLSGMDSDLFTYEVKVANIPCNSIMNDESEDETDDDMGYDPSDIRGDDEVELTEEESSDSEEEIAVDPNLLTNDIIGFKTYDDYKNEWIYEWNKDVPWVDEKPWTDTGVWTEPKPVIHTCKPFYYKTGCSEWPTYSWKDDGYCNGGNLPGTYLFENQLHYQDLEWYAALKDSKIKDEALRNKLPWKGSSMMMTTNHESPVCNIRKYMMIKYSFNNDDEYVAVKEDEYDDLSITRKEACQAYQEIFRIMDEGWMLTRAE